MRRRRTLVLDSNLLLLLCIGSIDPSWIKRVQRVNAFTAQDYNRLADIVSGFGTFVVTPHVLTEVNNLANDLRDDWKDAFAAIFKRFISQVEEIHVNARVLADDPLFRFGITDVSILNAAPFVLILTQDGRFASQLTQSQNALALDLQTAIALGEDLYRA